MLSRDQERVIELVVLNGTCTRMLYQPCNRAYIHVVVSQIIRIGMFLISRISPSPIPSPSVLLGFRIPSGISFIVIRIISTRTSHGLDHVS